MTPPAPLSTWSARAAALLDVRRYPEAEAAAREGLAQDPQSARAHGLLCQALLGQERLTDALEAATRHVAVSPESEWAYRQLAHVQLRLDKPRRAVAPALGAVRLAPANSATHLVAAEAYRGAGNLERARHHAELAVALAPESSDALSTLARVSSTAGVVGEAEDLYRRALVLNPENGVAMNNLGALLLGSGRRAEADSLFARAARTDPGLSVAPRNLAASARRRTQLSSRIQLSVPWWARVVILLVSLRIVLWLTGGGYVGVAVIALLLTALLVVNAVYAARRRAELSDPERRLVEDSGWRYQLSWRRRRGRPGSGVRSWPVIAAVTTAIVVWVVATLVTRAPLPALFWASMAGLWAGNLLWMSGGIGARLRQALVRRGWWPAPR